MSEASEQCPVNIVFHNVFTKLNCLERRWLPAPITDIARKILIFPIDRRIRRPSPVAKIAPCRQQSVYFYRTNIQFDGRRIQYADGSSSFISA